MARRSAIAEIHRPSTEGDAAGRIGCRDLVCIPHARHCADDTSKHCHLKSSREQMVQHFNTLAKPINTLNCIQLYTKKFYFQKAIQCISYMYKKCSLIICLFCEDLEIR